MRRAHGRREKFNGNDFQEKKDAELQLLSIELHLKSGNCLSEAGVRGDIAQAIRVSYYAGITNAVRARARSLESQLMRLANERKIDVDNIPEVKARRERKERAAKKREAARSKKRIR